VAKGRFASLEFGEAGPEAQAPAAPRAEARGPAAELRDADFYLRQAVAQELEGSFEAALRCYSAALGENPLLLDAWVGQLRVLLDLEEYPEARLWADKALERFPDNPQVLAAKSVALHRMGHKRDARALNDAAVQGKGEWPLVWLCRGELMMRDSSPAATECFNRALRGEGPKGPLLIRIGELLLRGGHYSTALTALQRAAAALPEAARAWYLMGQAQEELGMAAQARVSYQQAATLAPRIALYRQAAEGRPAGLMTTLRRFFRRLRGR